MCRWPCCHWVTVRKLSPEGVLLWSADVGGQFGRVAALSHNGDGIVWCNSNAASFGISKIDAITGDVLPGLSFTTGPVGGLDSTPTRVYVGQSGTVIGGGSALFSGVVKIDNSGARQWASAIAGSGAPFIDVDGNILCSSFSPGWSRLADANGASLFSLSTNPVSVTAICGDDDGSVYISLGYAPTTGEGKVKKYDDAGVLEWTYNHVYNLFGVSEHGGNIVAGGLERLGVSIISLDNAGGVNWTSNRIPQVFWMKMDDDGNAIVTGARSNGATTVKFDDSGNILWTFDHGADTLRVDADSEGNIYIGGAAARP